MKLPKFIVIVIWASILSVCVSLVVYTVVSKEPRSKLPDIEEKK